ncbi:MAG: plasmid partitioning protein RepB C-terminal domain-containing protein [Terracidiphilus sp.]|jgi:ParB family chromosome partitioning protein
MTEQAINDIPIAAIRIVNPRSRSKVKWQSIVQSIGALGLKRPITVAKHEGPDSHGRIYDLVCGQGRLEAFQALGQETIPAIAIEAAEQDLLLMSLVENIARRPSSTTAILDEVRTLRQRGHTTDDIAAKLGMDKSYIYGIAHLIDCGEDFLVRSVEAGRIPVSVATEIAAGHDQEVSRALSEAYEKGELRGHHLTAARRVITQCIAKRRREGKAQRDHRRLTGEALVREYKEKIREQKALIAKAERTKERLILLTSVIRTLLADENFTTLLKAEGLQKMPAELATRIS